MWIERQMFAIIEEPYKGITRKNNTRWISFINFDALLNSIHKTFHFADMTSHRAFLSSESRSSRARKSAERVWNTSIQIAPLKNHKSTDGATGLAKKCRRKSRHFWGTSLRRMHGGQPTSDPCFIKWRRLLNL